ncbi:hypothetical protein AKO1_008345 [Acrasis kona]|uniref:Uncharacterized protein n=1 Tax=Acrasis kona TaxID=1008807 RepID=A0AAW2YMY6_9EUKA
MEHTASDNNIEIEIESQNTKIDLHIVDPVRITQDAQQILRKDFDFVDVKPYNLQPLADSIFIEVVKTQTIEVAMREVIGRKDNSLIIRVTKGVLKKHHRQILMLHINGKRLLTQSLLRKTKKSSNKRLTRFR